MQLNDISIQENNITYNITLYGGIGDFFYGLKYKEDGTSKSLADIRYFIEDENGNVLEEKDEMNFEVNKEFVNECFNKDFNVEGNQLTDTITFIPAYNGVYDDFDSSKCLINTNELSTSVFPTSIEEDGVTYETVNGYGLANLEKDYTE
jgi:CRISPR/Cas system CMR-associated protein Cmr1 (group 7 of RAMP superfamily)